MTIIYQSQNFDIALIDKQYAAFSMFHDSYIRHDVDRKGRTIRTVKVERNALPAGIANECDAMKGYAFNQVRI